jgi:hypothetical protein
MVRSIMQSGSPRQVPVQCHLACRYPLQYADDKTGKHRGRACTPGCRDSLCTLCDHFAVQYRLNCGCVEYAKWTGDVLVTGEARPCEHDQLKLSSIARTAAVPEGLRTVSLPAGLTMLPVTGEVVHGLDPAAVGDERIPGDWVFRQPVAALAREISHDRKVLYIFSETAGGPGTKETIAWHKGRLLYGPSGTCDIEEDLQPGYHLAPRDNAVNAGLRAIGVQATDGNDEFGTVGLGRRRMTEDWLK